MCMEAHPALSYPILNSLSLPDLLYFPPYTVLSSLAFAPVCPLLQQDMAKDGFYHGT